MLFFLDAEFEEFSNVIDRTDSIGSFLTDGKELATGGESKSGDALTALDSRNESLHLLGHVVDDDVVATRVAHNVVIEVDHVVLHVSL